MQRVLNDEIVSDFSELLVVELSPEHLAHLAEYELGEDHAKKGLYILHYQGVPVYVGKAERSLYERLSEHRTKINSRTNILISEMGFTCLYLDKNWSALAHEKPLIRRLGCRWNQSGFGNHDPGRRRDKTVLKQTHFDRQFPIDANYPINCTAGTQTVASVLATVRQQAPYLLLRSETKKSTPKTHPLYHSKTVQLDAAETLKSAMGKVVDALGADWQVTFLYGYIILYRENHPYTSESAFLMKQGGQDWQTPAQATETADDDDDDEEGEIDEEEAVT